MDILEYDQVDPLGVLSLNLVSLNYALTPERVALIRRRDQRPFPFFAVYASEGGIVMGQVAVYRLPVVTSEGPEDVGAVCAVCTHPAFSRRGLATRLLEEAHARMRAAGLRFSTLGTTRYRRAYALYERQGYAPAFAASATGAAWGGAAKRDTPVRAARATAERLALTDDLFQRIAAGQLGFARRQAGFIAMTVAIGDLGADQVWLLWADAEPVGYAFASAADGVLTVDHLLLVEGVDAAAAVAALARAAGAAYVQVKVERPSVAQSLERAGYPPARPTWSSFMIKPLLPALSAEDARRLLGIGTQRFLISPIDIT